MNEALHNAYANVGHEEAEQYADCALDEREADVGELQAAIESVMSDNFGILSLTSQVQCLRTVMRQWLIERAASNKS